MRSLCDEVDKNWLQTKLFQAKRNAGPLLFCMRCGHSAPLHEQWEHEHWWGGWAVPVLPHTLHQFLQGLLYLPHRDRVCPYEGEVGINAGKVSINDGEGDLKGQFLFVEATPRNANGHRGGNRFAEFGIHWIIHTQLKPRTYVVTH